MTASLWKERCQLIWRYLSVVAEVRLVQVQEIRVDFGNTAQSALQCRACVSEPYAVNQLNRHS